MTIRGLLITPAARRKTPQQPQVGANLQQTTLAPVAAAQAPFNRTDWPNPVVRSTYRQLLQTENLQQTTLAPTGAVQAPFNRSEWPNPILRPVTMSRHFLVTTSFFDSPVPDIKFDFQNPVIKRRVQQPQVLPNLVLNTLYVAPPIPKVRLEFQNPVIARRVQQPYVLPNLQLSTLYVPPVATPSETGTIAIILRNRQLLFE